MNRSNCIPQLLHAALFSSALLAGQRNALAQTPATPTADGTAAAEPAPAAGPTPAPAAAPLATPAQPAATDGNDSNSSAPPPPPPVNEPPPPPAPESKPKDGLRFELGGRLGYAVPFGHVATSTPLKDVFSASVPGAFDAWLRFPNGLALGLYVGLAAGISGHALDSCPSCSALNYRFGLQLARHFNAGGVVDPWFGVGIGSEWASITEQVRSNGLDITYDSTYTALPELTALAGIDIGSDNVAFGPFVSLSYASYSKVSSTISCSNFGCGDGTTSSSSVDGGGHGWLTLGLRGTYLR